MDSRLLDALRNAPSLALNQMLADPRRILDVRRHLHLGSQVMYFDHRRGTLAPGRVPQLQATSATVQDTATHTQWKLPYAAIVADPAQRAEQAPAMLQRPVDVAEFKRGTRSASPTSTCANASAPSRASTRSHVRCCVTANSGLSPPDCCVRSSICKLRAEYGFR